MAVGLVDPKQYRVIISFYVESITGTTYETSKDYDAKFKLSECLQEMK